MWGDGKKKIDENKMEIIDKTPHQQKNLRKTIYLLIQSSISADEMAHKLLKMQKESNCEEALMASMILDCCAQERNRFLKFSRSLSLLSSLCFFV